MYHLLIVHWGSPQFQEYHQLRVQCDKGVPQRFLTRCPLSWSSLWTKLHFIILFLQALRQLSQEPMLEFWQGRIRLQAGRFIWPQNHKFSVTLNGPQQEGKNDQNTDSIPRAAVSSMWHFWLLSPFPALSTLHTQDLKPPRSLKIYLHLTLHIYSFLLFFLSFPLNIFVSFIFSALFPNWYLDLVFQLVL